MIEPAGPPSMAHSPATRTFIAFFNGREEAIRLIECSPPLLMDMLAAMDVRTLLTTACSDAASWRANLHEALGDRGTQAIRDLHALAGDEQLAAAWAIKAACVARGIAPARPA